jgi:hypothetical protein
MKQLYGYLFVLFSLMGTAYFQINYAEAALLCNTRLVSVVAHLDDDLLFINPGIINNFDKGACATSVHIIGGGGGTDMDTVCYREAGLRKAYARMANVPNEWTFDNIVFAGKFVTRMTLNANPKIKFFELRLQGGNARGSSRLQNLWDSPNGTMTMTSQSGAATQDRFADCEQGIANTYTRDELKATLLGILQDQKVTKLSTLNPDTTPWLEHPDHIYVARLTRETAKNLSNNIPISYHETYPTASLPFNVLGEELLRKRDIAATYFSYAVEFGIYTEHHWNGNWVPRRYQWTGHVHDDLPDWQAHPFELANELTTQCLTSTGINSPPFLMACTGARTQQWTYRPNGVGAGAINNVQLVSSSNNCIQYDNLGFLETACSANPNQYWTPWDFGIVRAPGWQGFDGNWTRSVNLPGNNCLSVENGALSTSSICDTAGTRWAPTRDSTFHDLRQENALVDDFTGDGNADLLFIQRAGRVGQFDPGFNVFLKDQAAGTATQAWYQNSVAVPWNQVQSIPPPGVVVGDHPCKTGSLCFDNSRFLSGDFDGDIGKHADLMVINAYQGGTGFWLLKSDGTQLSAPMLWKQTNATWNPSLSQQYVSADFTGDGKADVLIAHRRADRGLNLWVLSSNGATGNDPELWYAGKEISASANLKPAKLQSGNLQSDLLSIENGNPTLKIRRLINAGNTFTSLGAKGFRPLEYLSSKHVVADINADGLSDVIVLHKRSDGADINVWRMLNNNGGFSLPSYLGTISHTAWTDQISYAVTRKDQDPWLTMVARLNSSWQPWLSDPNNPGYNPNSPFFVSEANSNVTFYWRLGGSNIYTYPLNMNVFDTVGTDQGSVNPPSQFPPMYFQDILHIERLSK